MCAARPLWLLAGLAFAMTCPFFTCVPYVGDDDEATGDEDDTGTGCETSNNPTWTNFGECFFATYCTCCHTPSGSAPFSLVSYADAKANLDLSVERVGGGWMPVADPTPSNVEKQLLNDWAAAGAPE